MSRTGRQIHLSPRLLKQVLAPESSSIESLKRLTDRRWKSRGWVLLLAALLLAGMALAWQHGEFLSTWLKRLFHRTA